MPKIVDHEERRIVIADALFEALREGGFAEVTLASVAARAGLAIGSVRHFLGSREDMIRFAFEAVTSRVHDRIMARVETLRTELDRDDVDADARLTMTADLLSELLPMDAARFDECVVWLEFELAARNDAQLAATSQRAAAQTTRLMEIALESARTHGSLAASTDIALESTRLAALIDGLTTRCVLHPELTSPEDAYDVVVAHLRALRAAA